MKSNKKSLSKTLLVMDLDDASINLRDAEKEYDEIKEERETLEPRNSRRVVGRDRVPKRKCFSIGRRSEAASRKN